MCEINVVTISTVHPLTVCCSDSYLRLVLLLSATVWKTLRYQLNSQHVFEESWSQSSLDFS